MESQKDRFIRQFMHMVGSRKERILDHQSVERRQRIMPQGQKDLGIYPEDQIDPEPEEPNEPAMRFGFVEPLTLVSSDGLVEEGGLYTFDANENVSSMRFPSGFSFEVTSPNLVINNCDIFNIWAERTSAYKEIYTARFESCTFYFGGMTFKIKGSTFYRCDFTQFVEGVLVYYKLGYTDPEYTQQLIYNALFKEGTTYIESSISEDNFMPENWQTIWAPA